MKEVRDYEMPPLGFFKRRNGYAERFDYMLQMPVFIGFGDVPQYHRMQTCRGWWVLRVVVSLQPGWSSVAVRLSWGKCMTRWHKTRGDWL